MTILLDKFILLNFLNKSFRKSNLSLSSGVTSGKFRTHLGAVE